MGSALPPLSRAEFERRVHAAAPSFEDSLLDRSEASTCTGPLVATLYLHYLELRRWNPRLSLIGPGTAQQVPERHYSESLAALPLLEPDDQALVDIGSGAGFPGLVLAAARPDLEVTLFEPRQRKWAFLKTAARRMRLSCACLDVRVEPILPASFPQHVDVVTCRALTLPPGTLTALRARFPRLRLLLWCGERPPELTPGFELGRQVRLGSSHHRRIFEARPTTREQGR